MRDDAWTAKWIAEKLIDHDEITDASVIDSNHLVLSVNQMPGRIKIATMSTDVVRAADLHELCDSPTVEFALNIKKNAFLKQDAITFAEAFPLGLGSLSDLYTAANEKEFRAYLPKETRFILRGLRQHTAVQSVSQKNNRLYHVKLWKNKEKQVLSLNNYDLTADAVRDGIDRFGHPDLILASNPNCRISEEAAMAAQYSGVTILKWGELLGELNY